MSSIKRQTVKYLSSCFTVSVAQSECVCWQCAPSAAGVTWQRSWLTFNEMLIHGIYPFYCQLGSHIHKSMIGYPYPLRDDTEMRDNKGRRRLNGDWECVYGHKEEKREGQGSEKWQQENWSWAEGFVLHFPDLAPEPWVFPSSEERISFPFILVSSRLFIHWLVRLSVSERGAVKSITLTVLT